MGVASLGVGVVSFMGTAVPPLTVPLLGNSVQFAVEFVSPTDDPLTHDKLTVSLVILDIGTV